MFESKRRCLDGGEAGLQLRPGWCAGLRSLGRPPRSRTVFADAVSGPSERPQWVECSLRTEDAKGIALRIAKHGVSIAIPRTVGSKSDKASDLYCRFVGHDVQVQA